MSTKFSKFKFKPIVYSNHLSLPVDINAIRYRISVLKNVFEQVESIHNELRELSIKLDNEQQELTKDDDTDDNYDYRYNDELIDLEFTFYRVNRISAVFSMYAFLENSLNRICKDKQSKMNIPISFTDFSGNGIMRAKNYLDKYQIVDFSDSTCNGAWSKLKTLNKLRNALAHAEGDLEQVQCLDSNAVINTKGLSLFGSTIMISESYIIESFDCVEQFLIYVCKD